MKKEGNEREGSRRKKDGLVIRGSEMKVKRMKIKVFGV